MVLYRLSENSGGFGPCPAVRRMLSSSVTTSIQHKKSAEASGMASPEDSGCQGGPTSHLHGSGGESGSNASTSDQAPVKVDCEADMETSSLQEDMDCMDALTGGTVGRGSVGTVVPFGTADAAMNIIGGPDKMQMDCPVGGHGKPRAQPLKYKAPRVSLHGNGTGSSSGPKPCIGYPAGQMPPLPAGIPGIEWGLPTNPLQISPKVPPMGGLLSPMGWPGSPLMAPPLFPLMIGSPSPSVTSGGCATLPFSSSCLTFSSAANGPMAVKRADSAPLPAVSSLSTASVATTIGVDGFLQPPPPARISAVSMSKADLFIGLEQGKVLSPPIGLNLKKSPSLADFISQSLGDGSPAS